MCDFQCNRNPHETSPNRIIYFLSPGDRTQFAFSSIRCKFPGTNETIWQMTRKGPPTTHNTTHLHIAICTQQTSCLYFYKHRSTRRFFLRFCCVDYLLLFAIYSFLRDFNQSLCRGKQTECLINKKKKF